LRGITEWLLVLIILGSQGLAVSQDVVPQAVSDQVRDRLRARLETLWLVPRLIVAAESLPATEMLPLVYTRRIYQPVWSDDTGPSPRVEALRKVLREAEHEGFRGGEYHLAKIDTMLAEFHRQQAAKEPLSPDRLADFDLLLTDAFLTYGMHALSGRINPQTLQASWFIQPPEADLPAVLHSALATDHIAKALQSLLPSHPEYTKLRQTLAHYRAIARKGGWPLVPAGDKLLKGEHNARVAIVRARLRASGDLAPDVRPDAELFDDLLDRAVRRFQRRHGLQPDGIVGTATLSALNVPVEARVKQIAANLERWRWLPRSLGRRYVLVNIANFTLDVIEDDHPVLSMRIIVGKPYQHTPVFSALMTNLILNPSWYVPPSIAREEILPLLRRDPEYPAKQHLRVYRGQGTQWQELNPRTINWSQVSATHFPYRLRQEPGPKNPLGRIKFTFPNPFSIYLHDTSSPELFAQTVRTFSHGCIRIEKPIELAAYVLRGRARGSRDSIQAAIASGVEQTRALPQPLPIYLLYWTAWVDADGVVHFRPDVYDRDAPLGKALYSAVATLPRG
jgi:murein L,D-transpeptidase YcbB/YkuD